MLLNYDYIVKKHRVQAKGVLHLGASEGQEAPTYAKHGYKMAFVEALPNVYKKLCENVEKYGAVTYNACVSDVEGQHVEFNVANNEGQSSSILEFGTHTKEHPSVRFVGKIGMKTRRVDQLIEEIEDYDLLVMDLQGAELMALRGLGASLAKFKYVYTEVNKRHLYKGCPLIQDIDSYLSGYGFRRVETSMTQWGWGDAFYIKEEKHKANLSSKPLKLIEAQPRQPSPYPSHSTMEFEWWFKENYKLTQDREYLPIMWTAFQLVNEKNRGQNDKLQAYLNSLDRSKKYFTVVQHDDGIKFDLSHLDIKVFGMGKESDYPLPLICEPHQYYFNSDRDIFASFVGNLTHPIRRKIPRIRGYYIETKNHKPERFCEILSRSTFTLCPRGYGITSFRIMEALQFGSIPVYISDRFIIPHNIPFEDYGILVKESELRQLNDILHEVSEDEKERKRANMKIIFEQYFTYESNLKLISENL